MKLVFVGPSLPDAATLAGGDVTVRPPAALGDLYRAACDGADAIGLIDGNFEQVAPVWHKEILFALSQGVRVFGAASMGALRAAECGAFGMVGIGDIHRRFAAGDLVDDADVALLHGPEAVGYLPLTLPMVNVLATVEALGFAGALSDRLASRVVDAARAIFYKERTWAAIAGQVVCRDAGRGDLAELLRRGTVDRKRLDAIELLDVLRRCEDGRRASVPDWEFRATSLWKTAFP